MPKHYGRIVEETAIRRRMLSAANDIAKLAYQEATGVDTLMDEAEKAIFGVSERRMTRDLQSIQQVLSDYYDRIDQLVSRGEELYGVPTGFIDLDRLLSGMQPSDFLIIAGRPGMGKTAFLLSAAKNAAQTYKKHVAIFSLEMSNEQLVQRLLSQETGIDSQRLRTGKLDEDEWPVFTHAIEVLSDTHIFLDDTPALTPLQLRTKCRRMHAEVPARPDPGRLPPAYDQRHPLRESRPGSLQYLPQYESAGARAERAGIGGRTALPRGRAAHR